MMVILRKSKNKHLEFEDDQNIKIYADNDNDLNFGITNSKFNELKTLNAILNRTDEEETDILNYMKNNKTECALRF